MLDLVEANGGSARILASTVSAGTMYAERLRRAAQSGWSVLSQWDGGNVRGITASWRDDSSAVLVGTRSLMTRVDALVETCTLVIVDHAPQAASNHVDDARVEALTEAAGNRWAANRQVFVNDAG